MALTVEQQTTVQLLKRVIGADEVLDATVSEAALALHMSHEGLRGKLYSALQKLLGVESANWMESDLYIRDTFDSSVVYHFKGKEWRQKYNVVDGKPELVEKPAVVEMAYVDLANESAGAPVREERAHEVQYFSVATESRSEAEPGLIRVIAPGQGSSGYYPKEVLKRDGPKVFIKGLHMYWNHATEDMDKEYPAGDLNRQAGVLTGNGYWDENGPVGPGVYAPYYAFENYKPMINERAKFNAIQISWKGFIGYTEGQVAGHATKIVQSLNRAESVDFVTLAGAGGAIARASESAAPSRTEKTMATVPVEETELTKLRADASKATEAETRLAAATAALKAAREHAATAIVDRLFATKVIPDNAKETWRGLVLNKVTDYTKDEVLDAAAYESWVKTFIGPMPDVKAAESGTGQGAAEESARVNLGGGGFKPEDLTQEQAIQRAKENYIRRGFKPETAEKMARG